MRVTNLVAREHLRPDVILPSVTGQSEFRGNKSEHALKKTASTIMAVATGDKYAASNQTQKKVALAMALTITKFLSSHVVVLCAADHPYFCRRFGYCFSGFFCLVELERNKNAINCPELSRHAALGAVLLVGFAGAFRRSELAALKVEQVEFNSDGLVVSLDFSKADQEGKGETVSGREGGDGNDSVRLAPRHLSGARPQEKAGGFGRGHGRWTLFRAVDRHGRDSEEGLHANSIGAIVKRACRTAGYNAKEFAGHSLRAGLATQAAAANGVPERLIMRQTRHRSVTTLRRYIRQGSLFRENAAAKVGL